MRRGVRAHSQLQIRSLSESLPWSDSSALEPEDSLNDTLYALFDGQVVLQHDLAPPTLASPIDLDI